MRRSLSLFRHTYPYCGTWGRGTTPSALHSLTSHAIITHPESQNTRVLYICYNSSKRNQPLLVSAPTKKTNSNHIHGHSQKCRTGCLHWIIWTRATNQ